MLGIRHEFPASLWPKTLRLRTPAGYIAAHT
jgi:hypothetical protein